MSNHLRAVPEVPDRRHWLLAGTVSIEEIDQWAAMLVDPASSLVARQLAATMLSEAAKLALLRLEACATGAATAEAIIESRERVR